MMAPKMTGAMIGYARVSTDGQSTDAQRAALKSAGCTKIFAEKQSGVMSARKELARAIDALGAGDVLMVTRLDRLARSTRDLLNVLHIIADKKAGFKSLADSWADTTTSHGRLMLTVLGGLAEFERDLIRARTGEGRKRAMAAGVKFGRRPKLTPHHTLALEECAHECLVPGVCQSCHRRGLGVKDASRRLALCRSRSTSTRRTNRALIAGMSGRGMRIRTK